MITKQVCSNCGKTNVYTEKEWKGRENTLCKHCGHSLTVCFWIYSLMKQKNK